MTKKFLILLLFLSALSSHSQKLIYKSNGAILNEQNQKISPSEVRLILKNSQDLLVNYNVGRSKKTAGNIMLYGGLALIITDLAIGANADVVYPSALTYIGLTSLVISIPVKIGYSKKIKKVVNDYNSTQVGYQPHKINTLHFITNHNGAGLRLSFK